MSVRLIVAVLAIGFTALIAGAADNEDFNPYKNVKVGDFATYKLTVKVGQFNINGISTQTITAKTEKEATVKVVSSVNGMDLPTQTQTVDLTKPYDPSKVGGLPQGVEATVAKDKDGKEKVKVNGMEYDAVWTTYNVKAKAGGGDVDAKIKVWMSKDVPMGVVKMEMTGELASQKMEMTMEVSKTGNDKK